jgi:hypothetical protein
MKFNKESVGYVVVFTFVVCMAFVVILSAANTMTLSQVEANRKFAAQFAVLKAFGLADTATPRAEVESRYAASVKELAAPAPELAAKGAIAAGVDILCRKAGVRYEEIERLYLAGGFGSTLLPESALDIGLLASALAGKIEVAGNSALDGTILLAAHPELAASVAALRERITVVELAAEPGFQDAFADAMLFPEFEVA